MTLSVVLLIAAAAWVGIIVVRRNMGQMPGTMGVDLREFCAIWALMMTAMMLPTVAPFATLYSRTVTGNKLARMSLLILGYVLVWFAAAIPAYALAWVADRVVGAHPAGATTLAVVVFLACGIYQLTPLKDRCLTQCRSPLGFIFRFASLRGRTKELRIGIIHGGYCIGCCWALMALLVAFGLMNLAAMIALTAVVLAEKVAPGGRTIGRIVGVACIVCALIVVFEPGIAPGLRPAPMGPGPMKALVVGG